MTFKPKSIAFTISLCLGMTLLSACARGPVLCLPELPPPTDDVVDALVKVPSDEGQAWIVSLERHYQDQDAAREFCAHRGA